MPSEQGPGTQGKMAGQPVAELPRLASARIERPAQEPPQRVARVPKMVMPEQARAPMLAAEPEHQAMPPLVTEPRY